MGPGGTPTHRDPEAGLTLIELLVALTIFAVLAGGIVLLIDSGLALARNNRNRTIAANLASQEMDKVRQSAFTTLPVGLVSTDVAVDGVHYTVNRDSEWVNNNSATGACDSANATPKVLRVSVDVSWPDMRGVPPARSATVLTPPVGSYDPNTGHISVKVRDRDAVLLGAVPVRVVGPGVDRIITTTDALGTSPGCAFFTFLPAGTYTVSLGLAGYVDRQGNASPSQTTGVTVGAVSSVAFDYDQAASLQLTFATPDGGTPVSGLPVTLGNTAFLPSGTKLYPGTGLARTITNLFPFGDGYEVWAGDCADADPEGKDSSANAYWPGAQRDPALATTAGGVTTGTVTLRSVGIEYQENTTPDGSDTVVAVHAADNGCPSGETLTLATFTDNTGSARVALPYGTWTLQVPGHGPSSGSWPTVSVSPTAASVPTVNVWVG